MKNTGSITRDRLVVYLDDYLAVADMILGRFFGWIL